MIHIEVSFQKWHHDKVTPYNWWEIFVFHSFLLTNSEPHLDWWCDKQWSSCVWRRRKNGQLRSAGIGPEGCSAKAGAGFDLEYLKLELSYPVQHVFVCIFGASFNQPLLFLTSSVKGKQNCACRTGKHFDKDDILSQRLYYRLEYL